MNSEYGRTREQTRNEARRLQVLEAAAECFRRHGFHGASMAEISKTAGMSTGHIYHYFENKEAIIDAIVEQGLAELLAWLDGLGNGDGTFRSMLEEVDRGVGRTVEPRRSGLKLEVMAEAARSPKVSRTVRAADERARHQLRETLAAGRRPNVWTEGEIEGRVEFLFALFEGLAIRAVCHPDLDQAAVARVFRLAVRAVLEG